MLRTGRLISFEAGFAPSSSPVSHYPKYFYSLSKADALRIKVFAPLFTKSGRVQGRALAGSGVEPREGGNHYRSVLVMMTASSRGSS